MNRPVIEVQGLSKSFFQGENQLDVLRDINLHVMPADRIAIIGLSGSGKSTLLHLLGGLDVPSRGQVFIAGDEVATMNEAQLCKMRNESLGFIYQFHHLMGEFTALENVAMPLLIRGESKAAANQAALELLTLVGLAERTSHRPAQLSGGERQRVAIARALVGKPKCVLADEPTGNLDEKTAAQVDDLILKLSQELGISFVIVTHNRVLAERMDKVFELHSGELRISGETDLARGFA